MTYYIGSLPVTSCLEHHGILGMKWGKRRYQNEDGTLTEAGKARYYKQIDRDAKKDAKRYAKAKQYYGEGAGTRRKLLKGELSKKMENADMAAAKIVKRVASIAIPVAAIAGSAAMHYHARKNGDTMGVEDYTAFLLRKNYGKFNL